MWVTFTMQKQTLFSKLNLVKYKLLTSLCLIHCLNQGQLEETGRATPFLCKTKLEAENLVP